MVEICGKFCWEFLIVIWKDCLEEDVGDLGLKFGLYGGCGIDEVFFCVCSLDFLW